MTSLIPLFILLFSLFDNLDATRPNRDQVEEGRCLTCSKTCLHSADLRRAARSLQGSGKLRLPELPVLSLSCRSNDVSRPSFGKWNELQPPARDHHFTESFLPVRFPALTSKDRLVPEIFAPLLSITRTLYRCSDHDPSCSPFRLFSGILSIPSKP